MKQSNYCSFYIVEKMTKKKECKKRGARRDD